MPSPQQFRGGGGFDGAHRELAISDYGNDAPVSATVLLRKNTVLCMKNYTTDTIRNANKITDASDSEVEWTYLEFDDFANRIDEIARRKLPDGVMGGNLAGSEAKIRQETALMLMKVFLFRNLASMEAADADGKEYHLRKVVAIALRRQKAQMKRKLAVVNTRCASLVKPAAAPVRIRSI